jgi:CheY-like chemotaxis protein
MSITHRNMAGVRFFSRVLAIVCTNLDKTFSDFFVQNGMMGVLVYAQPSKALDAWQKVKSPHFIFDCDIANSTRDMDGYDLLQKLRDTEPEKSRLIVALMSAKPDACFSAWATTRLGANHVIGRTPADALRELQSSNWTTSKSTDCVIKDLNQVELLFKKFAGSSAARIRASIATDLRQACTLVAPMQYARLLASAMSSEYMRSAFLGSARKYLRARIQPDDLNLDAGELPILDAVLDI